MQNKFLPLSADDIKNLGWDYVDIVFITGDAYVDHPSFAMAVIGRVLQARGYRVAILAQPRWTSCEDFKIFGRPRLFFAVSAGNMDSMINKYTSNKRIRGEDNYSPGGAANLRPDRATIIYSQRARQAFKDVPIIIGGIEASLRRFAHYDYWSDKVRKSVLLDSKADMLIYGMGEKPITLIADALSKGKNIKTIRNIRQTMFPLGMKEYSTFKTENFRALPSFEEVSSDKIKFSDATRAVYEESNPHNAKPLIQISGAQAVAQNPPDLPLTEKEMDFIYDLPYQKKPHPSYTKKIPAFEMIKNSVISHRGCFGGCSFCALAIHQGRFIQSRSFHSIEKEVLNICDQNKKSAIVSDIGGPSANMYKINAKDIKICERCKKISCISPNICKNLKTDFKPLLALIKKIRQLNKVKKIFIASGIRMDLALLCDKYIKELAEFHTSGHLKVAPEHISDKTLEIMNKPNKRVFIEFAKKFKEAGQAAGKEQYILPYFISAHPGSTLKDMAELAVFLKKNNYRPEQINDFLPAPMSISASIYYTGLDPFTLRPVYTAKKETERKMQRALLQYFKPENKKLIIKALQKIGRMDLLKYLTK